MRAVVLTAPLLLAAGCLVDPGEIVSEAELRLTVQRAPATADALEITVTSEGETSPAWAVSPDPAPEITLYVHALPVGAYVVRARALTQGVEVSCILRTVDNTAGQQHLLLDLARAADACDAPGSHGAGNEEGGPDDDDHERDEATARK